MKSQKDLASDGLLKIRTEESRGKRDFIDNLSAQSVILARRGTNKLPFNFRKNSIKEEFCW